MEKTINCTSCHRTLRITEPVQRKKEDMEVVTCPACSTPSKVSWPVFAGTRSVELV